MSHHQEDPDFERKLRGYLDIYTTLIGKIVSNLQSLEFALRAFLYSKEDSSHTPLPPEKKLYDFAVGEWVPENAMTCYDSLGELIKRYNNIVGKESRLDQSIVHLRDVIAHGRASAIQPSANYHLIKFSKPSEGMVKVEFSWKVTEDWLKAQVDQTATAVKTVAACLDHLKEE